MWKSIWVLFFIFPSWMNAQEDQVQVILKVKDIYPITVEPFSEIHVSRKGIVHLNKVSDQKWQLIALKPGFLIVKVEGESRSKIYMVEVLKEASETKKSKTDLPEELCLFPEVHCDSATNIMSGSMDRFSRFQHIRDYAKNQKHLTFEGRLSRKGQQDAEKTLRGMLPTHHQITVSELGMVHISVSCTRTDEEQTKQKNHITSLLKEFVTKEHLTIECLGYHVPKHYMVRAVFFLVKEMVAKDVGLETEIAADLTNFKLNPAQLFSSLKNRLNEKDVRVLAEPLIKTQSFRQTKIKTGGELPYKKAGTKHAGATTWKQHGIVFQFDLQPVSDLRANFYYTCELTLPLLDSTGAQVSSISGEIVAENGKLEFAGALSFEHTQSGSSIVPILNKIPIIAPLFKEDKTDHEKSYLVLFLKIEETN